MKAHYIVEKEAYHKEYKTKHYVLILYSQKH